MESQDKKLAALHHCSMSILDRIGICFDNPEALAIAADYGCRVEKNVVRFSPDQVMEWVKKAPQQFVLSAGNPDYDAWIGAGAVEYLAGYGAPCLMDFDGNLRPALFEDYIKFLKLIEVHDLFHVNGGLPVQPGDIPPENATALMVAATLLHSQKGLWIPNAHGRELDIIFELLDAWFGKDLDHKVCAMTLINCLSPLKYDSHALENCMRYAQRGQALVISGGALIGATGVLSLAGSFAQANAETLAGIALAQMVNPGTPVVYGMMSSISDMATGTAAVGCPEKALATRWNARLAEFYDLPCRAGGVDNDAHGVNIQAGMESMFALGATVAAKTNVVIHAAGTLAGYAAMSYEKFIADLDMLAMLKTYTKDIEVNEETLAFEVIKETGIGGQYLTHPHTFAHCRDTVWLPRLGVRRPLKKINAGEELNNRAQKEKLRLLNAYQMPKTAPEKQKRILSILKAHGIEDTKLINAMGR